MFDLIMQTYNGKILSAECECDIKGEECDNPHQVHVALYESHSVVVK